MCCSFQPVLYSLFFRDLFKGTNHALWLLFRVSCIWQCPSPDSPFVSPAPSPSCVFRWMYSGRTTEWGEDDKNNFSLEEYWSPSRVVPCSNNMGAVRTHRQERCLSALSLLQAELSVQTQDKERTQGPQPPTQSSCFQRALAVRLCFLCLRLWLLVSYPAVVFQLVPVHQAY